MNYSKPKLIPLETAIKLIASCNSKPDGCDFDAPHPITNLKTATAYEVDE